ncbi:SecDF P1 head subdomain-containing protein [Oligella urethralis]|uniref:SecDF P1 head subdomain-containing protein n=1 Tax=Oligella urethralis TaxID=90245 RepID=UPI000DFA37EE|nr:hypothetical protein [Oligella urethralis]SUA59624.1 preprotein translocase subunit SecD [Oligella urethralis]
MQINKKLLMGVVVSSTLLAGCQTFNDFMDGTFGSSSKTQRTTGTGTPLENVPKTPPPPYQGSTERTTTSSLVIYASSATPIDGYVMVERNNQRIYVDPRQTLLRSDLKNVLAEQDDQGRPYVRLFFNPNGSQKLQRITSQNIGRSLTVTYKDNLISNLNINRAVSDGILNVPMASANDAIALEGRILDGD